MQTGLCRLCQKQKPLLTKSHIIPKWLQFGLYDEKHKIAEFNVDQNKRIKLRSDTFYESNLLCFDCDGKLISDLENYAKGIYHANNKFRDFTVLAEEGPSKEDLPIARWPVSDYKMLKLFWLSILWRMHICTLPFFKGVDLGNKHSEILRKAILERSYVHPEDYSVAVLAPEGAPDVLFRMITAPRRIRHNQNSYYVQLVNGLFVMINISPVDEMSIIQGACLRDDGFMRIPILRDQFATMFYDSILGGEYKYRMK